MKIRRRYRKRRGPLPLKYVLLITLVTFIIVTYQSLNIINKHIEPSLIKIAETKAREFASQAVNKAIAQDVTANIDVNELLIVHNNSGEVSYSFNPRVSNRVIAETTRKIQRYLNLLEDGNIEDLEAFKEFNADESKKQRGIIYEIPIGMATNNTLFSNLGPKVPVRFEIVGDVIANIETKIKETGINNTYLEVYVKTNIQMSVIIPLVEKDINVVNSVSIGNLFLPGKVPQYYNGGGKGGSEVNPIVIPDGDG
ncbi:sporulation protein YunB [Neobacillus notoginsengisoli]|uniref:Sporulation protein YunB n=1 Tax=Neobacillus notoginsengisoli TaxID=1578198 RepID=A0A417YWA6_9BACI|nr:sporulation protein YunB [Neobacillus notoginsengisoli]RHW41690.1 sporulation protein YunB [Neobacillus notoginsengisoli]